MTLSPSNWNGRPVVFWVALTALVLPPFLPAVLQGKEAVASSPNIMETGWATQGFFTNLAKGIAIVIAMIVLRKIIVFIRRSVRKEK